MKKQILVGLIALAAGISQAHAAIATNNLTGTIAFDGWEDLKAGTLTTAQLTAGFGSNEAGSGDALVTRVSGGHYPSGSSLYSFTTDSSFSVSDATAVSGLETVVFSIKTWLNGDAWSAAAPTLSYNGGSQSLAAGLTGSKTDGSIDFGGPIDLYTYTFQWDLSGLGVNSFNVNWGQLAHTGVLALQLEQSDTFSVSSEVAAVPVPAAAWLFGSGLLGLAGVSRRRKAA